MHDQPKEPHECAKTLWHEPAHGLSRAPLCMPQWRHIIIRMCLCPLQSIDDRLALCRARQ